VTPRWGRWSRSGGQTHRARRGHWGGKGGGAGGGPPHPLRAASRASYQVTKLPQDSGAADWRGGSQSERGAAVLGQEAWRHAHLPATPSEARGHTIAGARWPRDTHTLQHTDTRSGRHRTGSGMRRDTTQTHISAILTHTQSRNSDPLPPSQRHPALSRHKQVRYILNTQYHPDTQCY
jgi:hypothetical protein